MRLEIFPYTSTPNGCTVCFRVNGGPIQQRHFRPGITVAEISAEIQGKPIPQPDREAEARAKQEKERQERAEKSQVPETTPEDKLHQQDSERDKSVMELNYMRQKLKEAHVKGYQMFKAETVRKKYNELVDQGIIKEDAAQ